MPALRTCSIKASMMLSSNSFWGILIENLAQSPVLIDFVCASLGYSLHVT